MPLSAFDILPDSYGVVQDKNRPVQRGSLRDKLYIIIFQSGTPAGRAFDIALFSLIALNVALLMLESIDKYAVRYHTIFHLLDYFFMGVFTTEYLLRLYCVRSKKMYATSFYGMVDLLSVLPSYLEFLYPQWHMLMVIRSFRLLRIFRIFRLAHFLNESRYLMFALVRSSRKIVVFLFFVILLTILLGAVMYVVEFGQGSGFTSIPQSIYWAVVTITTVGYGDIAPVTTLGKFIASFIMILGYAIIAVPTGFMSAAAITERRIRQGKNNCPRCFYNFNDTDANYCPRCGEKLKPAATAQP